MLIADTITEYMKRRNNDNNKNWYAKRQRKKDLQRF